MTGRASLLLYSGTYHRTETCLGPVVCVSNTVFTSKTLVALPSMWLVRQLISIMVSLSMQYSKGARNATANANEWHAGRTDLEI